MKLKFLPSLLLGAGLLLTSVASAQWIQLGTGNDTLATDGYDVNTLCTDPTGNVYAAGQFQDAGQNQYVAKWNGTTWTELGTGSNALSANGDIYSICSDPSGNIYAAGHFTTGGMGYVAKWNGTSWSQLGTSFGATLVQDINSITSDAQGNIYAAGQIAFFGGTSINYEVLKWDGSAWGVVGGTSNGLHGNAAISVITLDGAGNVYATGDFTNGASAGAGHPYVAKFNGTAWSEVGAGSGALNIPFGSKGNALVVDGSNNVYVAGTFTNTQGNHYVAKWNGSAWSQLGGAASFGSTVQDNEVEALAIDGSGNVYAGGGIIDATTAHNVVLKWNGSSWSNFGHFDNLAQDNAGIRSLIYSHNTFYVTGGNMNTRNARFVAKYNGQGNNTGVSELDANEYSLYPNPATSALHIRFAQALTATVIITDITGQEVANYSITAEASKTFSTVSLSSGMYLVKVTTLSGDSRTTKLVKE